MALGKRQKEKQQDLWLTWEDIPQSPGHPFYEKLNGLLSKHGFDAFCQEKCKPFYAEKMGRPSLPPEIYFRAMIVGYFEGIDSERGIAWRCQDSLSLRTFLGYGLKESTPDHSTISRTRRLIAFETHEEIFQKILSILMEEGEIKGKTLGVDATTLEANAAMKSIVRRDTAETYNEFLERLAKASGIETPTREDLTKMDRTRKKKGSNKDWYNPHDPEAKIAKMKDGRTHLAYKAEHAVDMETGAVVAVTVQPADQGDTTTMLTTLQETLENLGAVMEIPEENQKIEIVADKGYHSNDSLVTLQETEFRSYISEPDRGRRTWKGKEMERVAVYANRRRIRGRRGKALQRKRGEMVERTFAHALETGDMRRVHLRGMENIAKRYLLHVCGLNLGVILRRKFRLGTPRGWGDALKSMSERAEKGRKLVSQVIFQLSAWVGVVIRQMRRPFIRAFPNQRKLTWLQDAV